MAMDMATVMATATARKPKPSVAFSSLTPLALAMGCMVTSAMAGEWTITPSITVQETMTDNVGLSSTNKQSDLVTDISPGISIVGSAGATKLNLNYALHGLFYARDSSRNGMDAQNSLNASGTLEVLEDWFFIDATGRIAQQNISPFGGSRSGSVNVNTNDNATETSSYSLSPYFRGNLGGVANYLLRYNMSTTTSDSGGAYDADTRELILNLKGVTTLANFGWSISASSQDVDYGGNSFSGNRFANDRNYESDSVRGVLTYQVSPQFRVSAIGGREANDYLTRDKESHSIKGGGLEWSPTQRTQLSATVEDRYFGNSHNIQFTHRTAHTVWSYSDSKDASANPDQQAGMGTYYDYYSSLALGIPEAQRAAYVNALLLLTGHSPNDQLPGGYLTSGVSIQYRRQLSFAITGVRNTVTFAGWQGKTEDLARGVGNGLLIGNDFAVYDNIRQRGASVSWSRQLTPKSTLVGAASHMRSKGSGTSAVETTEKRLDLTFVTSLGPATSGSIGARRVMFDGDSNYGDYTENALIATLSHRF